MAQLPDRIGPYAIVGLLGEGGSGHVYLAEQSEPIRRTVALKVLESIEGSEHSLARFEIERLALAVMDHPSIAKIFDAGITADGHPYVAMERVEGVPIGQYCDDRRLTVHERVKLFAEACRAVHHAHQKGVIHRDLKPSHLLITEDDGLARLRIIDFGIAMAFEHGEEVPSEPDASDDREVVGTPGYMSPEQMEGSFDIDTRSDIYSLGVILYELLVGVPPFDFGRRRGWAAVALQLEDLPTPTRRLVSLDDTQDTLASHRSTTPRGLRRALLGDLDSIVTRAMSKDRDDRYETARDLWLDLERYLSSEPVEARKGGPVYRAVKFTRRHRVGVAFAVLAAAGLASFGVTAAVQARQIAQARDEASLRRSQAEALIDFMLTDLTSRLQPLGRLDLLNAVGEEALEYLAATPERYIDDDELFRRVGALLLIGQVRERQGDLPAAREAYERALALNRDLVERAPDNTDWLFGLGQTLYYVGYVDYRVGEYDAALEHFRPYLTISEDLVARDPSHLPWLAELAYSHSNIGSVLENQGELDDALAEFSTSLEIFERLAAAEEQGTTWHLDLADTYNTTGDVLRGLGRLEEARDAFAEEVRLKQELVDLDASNAFARARLATGHNYLAQVLFALGDESSALAHFRNAAAYWTELVELDPSNAQWRRNWAVNQQQEANILAASGNLPGALGRLSSAEATLDEIVSDDRTDPGRRLDLAEILVDRASVLHAMGRQSDARSAVRDAQGLLDVLTRELPGDREMLRVRAESSNVAGVIQAGLGDEAGARSAWSTTVEVLGPLAGESSDPRYVVPCLEALLHLDRLEDARPIIRRLEQTGYRDRELAALVNGAGLETEIGRRPME